MTEKRKRIVFDVNLDLHQQVKILAAVKKISMNCWITRAIQQQISKEAKCDERNDDGKQ